MSKNGKNLKSPYASSAPFDAFTKHFMQPDSRWLPEKMDKKTRTFLEDLKSNIAWHDIREFIPLVREKNGKLQIICGHLRIRSLMELYEEEKMQFRMKEGKPLLLEGKHYILKEIGDDNSRKLWLFDNIHRKDLSIAEVLSVVEFYLEKAGGSSREAAKLMKKPPSWIEVRKQVLQSKYRKEVENGSMSLYGAYDLVKETRSKKEEPTKNLEEIQEELENIGGFADQVKEMAVELELDNAFTEVADEILKSELPEEMETPHRVTPPAELFKRPTAERIETDSRCHFFGFKMDAPAVRCINCAKDLEEECTAKSKENIKVGSIPPNHEKTIEIIGLELSKIILDIDDWQAALVKFAKQSWNGGRYDIKKVKINKYHSKMLKSHWNNFQKVAATYSNSLENMDRINQAYQAWNDYRRDIFKSLQGAVIRVRLSSGGLDKKLDEITFDDLNFLKPCSTCKIPGSKKHKWKWIPNNETECRECKNKPVNNNIVASRSDILSANTFTPNPKSNCLPGESIFFRSSSLVPRRLMPIIRKEWTELRIEYIGRATKENSHNYRLYYIQKTTEEDKATIKKFDEWFKKLNADERSRVKDKNYDGPTTESLHSIQQKEAEEVGG